MLPPVWSGVQGKIHSDTLWIPLVILDSYWKWSLKNVIFHSYISLSEDKPTTFGNPIRSDQYLRNMVEIYIYIHTYIYIHIYIHTYIYIYTYIYTYIYIHTHIYIDIPIGSMVLLYMVTWIPSIYPLYVSIYTSTMDPSWVLKYILNSKPLLVSHWKIWFTWTSKIGQTNGRWKSVQKLSDSLWLFSSSPWKMMAHRNRWFTVLKHG